MKRLALVAGAFVCDPQAGKWVNFAAEDPKCYLGEAIIGSIIANVDKILDKNKNNVK